MRTLKISNNGFISLKPKDIRDEGVSERNLCKIKHQMKQGKIFNPKTNIVKILI